MQSQPLNHKSFKNEIRLSDGWVQSQPLNHIQPLNHKGVPHSLSNMTVERSTTQPQKLKNKIDSKWLNAKSTTQPQKL